MPYTITPNTTPFTACYRNGVKNRLAYGGYLGGNYGPVTIVTETLTPAPPPGTFQLGPRPVSVSGIVIPSGAVGPHVNPNPSGGWITVGELEVDKGHIFGLGLGGPNIPQNVVPQWGAWNQYGRWRVAEKAIKDLARALYLGTMAVVWPNFGLPVPPATATHVKFEIILQYKNLPHLLTTPSITQWAFPNTWVITAYPCNVAGAMQGANFIYNKYRVPGAVPKAWHNAVT